MSKEKILRRILDAAESVNQSVIIRFGDSKCTIKEIEGILPYRIKNNKLYIFDCVGGCWCSYNINLITGIIMVLI